MDTRPTVTQLLALASAGDHTALDRALPLVYSELRGIARRQLRREAAGHTLNSGALVHEAYIRLVDQSAVQWRDRGHFLAVAAVAMRRILIDSARRRRAGRRGGGAHRVPLDRVDVATPDGQADLLLELDEALTRLAVLDQRQARVVECRFFGGLTEEETAAALGIGLRTAKRDWAKARSWLFQQLYPEAVE